MSVNEWSKASVDYGRKLVDSGLEGAHAGEEAFLHGQPLAPFLGRSARKALTSAVIGAGLGLIGSCLSKGERSARKSLAFTFLGSAIGFATGLAWQSRRLTASMASSAMKNIEKTRDEHWLEKNPIDYA